MKTSLQIEKELIIDKRKYEENLIKKAKTNPKLVYAYVKQKQNVKSYIRGVVNGNGDVTTDNVEIVNALNHQFESVFVKNEDNNFPYFNSRTRVICDDPIFNTEVVKEKISILKSFKSVGVDNVHGYVLRKCVNQLAEPLSIIFNLSYLNGEVPSIWKKANITPLYKKGSRLEVSNYRPVSLTSIVCKLMESIIKDKMVEHLDNNKLISKNQHGFVKNKSCVTNLMETIDTITYNLWHKQPTDVIFLDFAKAFDTVPHKRLLIKLRAYGINEKMINWIKSFFSKRQQRVVMGECVSNWASVLSGVPQGSILGPLLFIVYIDDISDNLENICKLYADDTKLIANMNTIDAYSKLQSDIDKIFKWSSEWLIKLNNGKCKLMHFGKNNGQQNYSIINDNGEFETIDKSSCEKDLGIMINSDCKWKHQVDYACSKANRVIGMLTRTFSYLNVQMVQQLYKVFVRPHLEYAVSVWCPYLVQDIKAIERVQHRMTRLLPELRDLPYENRLQKLNLTSLELRRKRGDIIQMYKLFNNDYVRWCNQDFMNIPNYYSTRGHNKKLKTELVKNCNQRFNFYSNRVVSLWNGLDSEAVNAQNMNAFKKAIEHNYGSVVDG